MKKALVFGITGQDGAYLSALLVKKGYQVIGTSRNRSQNKTANLLKLGVLEQVRIEETNVENKADVYSLIQNIQPDEIYYLAGQSSAAASFEFPAETFNGIVSGTLNVLEAVRKNSPTIRAFFAGSGDAFGNPIDSAITENTPLEPRNPYAVARVAAYWLVRNYRELFGLFACTGILFNHESPLRPAQFVTRKIIDTVKAIAEGRESELRVGRLDIERDWGWAAEYVEAMYLMLQADRPHDYVIAAGQSISLRQFIHEVFSFYNLKSEDYVISDPKFMRPNEILKIKVNPQEIQKNLGWKAKTYGKQVIQKMMRNELF